ncbi:peptidylprolyl isomerase FKBP-type [Methanolacinia petrolearia DSM 11571]|uniref:Peptidyl-prolyl cis-trans isomerase n=1 Tax=Methanolacinia petrolearia (strain DSM 11571 / OCM 486 / SEBR 4847) TaxID=679926 RepID=E1RDP7_METP4|nr:FKBP-type peptidyl-prolyl cis-trans isomerase [Methanolacinia petrolearia]ADN36000.1 peptidylprolyl isomerase FKBP-type [Methanolacinia petrolearia DSM 11571]
MAKKITFLLVLSAALLLVLFSGCTDSTGNTNTNNNNVTEEFTFTVTPEATKEINTTSTGIVAEEGDTVSVQYIGTYNNGTVFDESQPGDPLVFTLGNKSMITGFEDAVYGMEIGETKSIHLTPDQAYGEYNPDYLINISRDMISNDTEIYEGDQIILKSADGSLFQVTVVEITNDTVVVDANSMMAGKELNFEITLEDIDKA